MKRWRKKQDTEPLLYESFVVDLIDQKGSIMTFNLRPSTKLSSMYEAYEREKNEEIYNLVLYLNGVPIKNNDVIVKSTRLKAGDVINVFYDTISSGK